MMKKILFAVAFLIVFTTLHARAQIMEGVYNKMTEPSDQAAQRHFNVFPGTGYPGDAEIVKNQEQRYDEATKDGDMAAERHVNMEINTDEMKK